MSGGCYFCKRKRVALASSTEWPWTQCADQQDCRAYRDERWRKQREASEKRSGRLVLREAPAEGKPYRKGHCSWCGKPIKLTDPDDHRRAQRTRHRGDEHEVGDRNCVAEYLSSFAHNARELVEKRGDPSCVDCGSTDLWDADHDVPLWKGGEHSPENIVRRCDDCHREKTKAEAAERAAMRRHSTQPELQEAA